MTLEGEYYPEMLRAFINAKVAILMTLEGEYYHFKTGRGAGSVTVAILMTLEGEYYLPSRLGG